MKRCLLFLFCLLNSGIMMAQKGDPHSFNKFYVNVGIGGGVSTSSSFNMLYDYDGKSTPPTVNVHPVGFGNGFNGYATFGYRFIKYLAVEVSVNEFLGIPVSGDSVVNILGASQSDVKIGGRLLSVIPAIVISAGLEKINPYARFGLLIGAIPSVISKYSNGNATTNPATSLEIYNHYYGGVALGYAAAGGATFKITKLINLFAELQFTHATWSPDHSEITQYTVNGQDKLPTLSTYEKQVDYVFKKAISGTLDLSQPRQELKETMPFSTFAINAGITFNF
jgi:hypothetical protein